MSNDLLKSPDNHIVENEAERLDEHCAIDRKAVLKTPQRWQIANQQSRVSSFDRLTRLRWACVCLFIAYLVISISVISRISRQSLPHGNWNVDAIAYVFGFLAVAVLVICIWLQLVVLIATGSSVQTYLGMLCVWLLVGWMPLWNLPLFIIFDRVVARRIKKSAL